MRRYEHRQTSYRMAALGAVLVAWVIGSAILFEGSVVFSIVIAVIVGVVMGAFTTLRTSVDRSTVRAAFAYGWPRRAIAVSDIEAHEPVRNKWYYGWGVRLVPGGVLFSVWGLDAVAVTYRKGGRTKSLRIGTDDVAGLDAAIAEARASRPRTG